MVASYPYTPYFWAAYAATAIIYVAYGVSLYRRHARARQRAATSRVADS